MGFLTIGDAVPWFTAASTANPQYHFDTLGGQPIVLYFFAESGHAETLAILEGFQAKQSDLAGLGAILVAVGACQPDAFLSDRFPDSAQFQLLWDPKRQASRACGYDINQNELNSPSLLLILDQRLRIHDILAVQKESTSQTLEQAIAQLAQLPYLPTGMAARQAPVLFIPGVFEPEFCQQLIELLKTHGGSRTGVLEEQQDGQTVNVAIDTLKRRRDLPLEKAGMDWINKLTEHVVRRIKPEIEKAFQYSISSFERPVVACYDAADQGFFGCHRDNMTVEGAKRRFAMTVNLNTGEYEGGCLQFPEFGNQLFSPEVGEAAIFGCSLMHQVTPVTHGQRYAFLLFFNEPERTPQTITSLPKKAKRTKSGRGFK